MTELFEKSIHTLELPKVLDLLAAQAVTEEGKRRARELRPETDPDEVAKRLKESSGAVPPSAASGPWPALSREPIWGAA